MRLQAPLNATFLDLAAGVHAELLRRGRRCPSRSVLCKLFSAMFQASISKEEGQSIRFQIAYFSPDEPERLPPAPPPTRHSIITLPTPLECSARAFQKIAPACDPRSTALAVFAGRAQRLQIWGMIDQQNQYFDFLTHEPVFGGPPRPGLFQASVEGPGHIRVTLEYERLAELRGGQIARQALNVLDGGPIRRALEPGILTAWRRVKGALLPEVDRIRRDAARVQTSDVWRTVLSRILLRIQGFHHGGALIVTPDRKLSALKIKYPLHYSRLSRAVVKQVAVHAVAAQATSELNELRNAKAELAPLSLCDRHYYNRHRTCRYC